jgi:integral membrane sensor domain MASE1
MKGKCEDRMTAYAFRCFPKRIDIPVALRDQPVDACQTSARLAHVLRRSGIRVLGDLQGRKVGYFACQKNCGLYTLHELDSLVRRVQSLAENASRAKNGTYSRRSACCAVAQRRRLGKVHASYRKAGTEARFSIPESVCKLQFDELPITKRLASVVRSIEARTLGDLNGLSACELLQCKNCYWRTVAEIEQLIERAIAGEFDLTHIDESEAAAELLTLLEQGMAKLSRRENQFLLAISGLPVIGLLTLVYFIAGKFGLMLASLHASASPVWPPAGIALAALLVLGYRAWPAIFVGAFLVNVTTAGNVATSLAVASGNTLEAVCGAWLVNRFAGGTTVFDRPQGVFKFALAAVVSTIISPAFGVTSLALAGFADWTNYGAIWLTWWLGDTTGDLLIAPLIILWSIASKRRWNRREAVEVGILLLLLFVLSEAVFGGWLTISARNYPIAFICGAIVIWTAFRFTQRETATGIFILSAIAIWGTLHGFGPFAGETENQSLLALQSWTAVLTITAMALSAGMAERGRAEEALRESEARINLAANAANLGLWLWNIRDDKLWVTEKWRKLFGFAESEPSEL